MDTGHYKYDFSTLDTDDDTKGIDLVMQFVLKLEADLHRALQNPEQFKKDTKYKKDVPIPNFFKPRFERTLHTLLKYTENNSLFFDLEDLYARIDSAFKPHTVQYFGTQFLKLASLRPQFSERLLWLYAEVKEVAKSTKKKKLRMLRTRTLQPLLDACLTQRNVDLAMQCYREFRDDFKILIGDESFASLITLLIKTGRAKLGSEEVNEILINIVEQCTTIDQSLWFKLRELCSLFDWSFQESRAVGIEGLYSEKNKIPKITLSDQEIETFKQKFVKEDMKERFDKFEERLRKDNYADVFIDGANVGHFAVKQGTFSYWQIDAVYEHFKEKGKKTRVVLHEGRIARIERERGELYDLLQKWLNEDALYICPKGINDDCWWIFAGLCSFKKNPNVMFITNDLLRDHANKAEQMLLFSWLISRCCRYRTVQRVNQSGEAYASSKRRQSPVYANHEESNKRMKSSPIPQSKMRSDSPSNSDSPRHARNEDSPSRKRALDDDNMEPRPKKKIKIDTKDEHSSTLSSKPDSQIKKGNHPNVCRTTNLTTRVFDLDYFEPFDFQIHCMHKDDCFFLPVMREGKPFETLYQNDEKNDLPPVPCSILDRVIWNVIDTSSRGKSERA